MNRYYHTYNCNDCDKPYFVEIPEMVSQLPDNTRCHHCQSPNLTKMANHLREPTPQLIQKTKEAFVARNGNLRGYNVETGLTLTGIELLDID